MSYHQITMDEYLFGEEDPLRAVVREASPETIRDRLDIWVCLMSGTPLDARKVEFVRKKYIPYGYAGHFGGDVEYSMAPRGVRVIYKRKETIYSWKQFAETLLDMCRSGEYRTEGRK